MRTRILFISTLEVSPWGGSEQLWSDMALRMTTNGCDVMTNTLQWNEKPSQLLALEEAGVKTTFRPNLHTATKTDWINNKLLDKSWRKEVLAFKPDVIVINQGGSFDNAVNGMLPTIYGLDCPYYIISCYCPECSMISDEERVLMRDYYSKAEKVLFASLRNKESAEIALAKDINNAAVFKNTIRLTEKPAMYPKDDIYKLATMARFNVMVKGYDILINTFSQPQWEDRNYELHLYGSGEDKQYIEDLVEYRGLGSKVIFKGFADAMHKVWEECHLLLLPSRGEGKPLSLMEANFCKRAAVVTDVGGNAEIVREGVNGFIAETPTVASFSAVMERAWEIREDWEFMGKEAERIIEAEYGGDAVGEMVNLVLTT